MYENKLEDKSFYKKVEDIDIGLVNTIICAKDWENFSELVQTIFDGGITVYRLREEETFYAIGHNFKCCVLIIEEEVK